MKKQTHTLTGYLKKIAEISIHFQLVEAVETRENMKYARIKEKVLKKESSVCVVR